MIKYLYVETVLKIETGKLWKDVTIQMPYKGAQNKKMNSERVL